VGGTEFKDASNYSQYWAASNGAGGGSALGYIPEAAWNESASGGLWASGGGVSTVYTKPSWQAAPGVPSDGMRDVPDVAMTGASHDAYLIELNGGLYCVGGTSAAAPSFASLMALVVQSAHGAQGNANPGLYRLASQQLSAGGAAVFHDTTSGNNGVPGVTGFSAGAGYDQATGLGSVDGSILVNQWGVNNSTGFTIAANASTATLAQGGTATIAVSLTAQGGFSSAATLTASGLPTGVSVKFSATSVKAGAPVTATFTATVSAAPGTYAVTFGGAGAGVTATTKVSVTVVAPSFALGTSAGSTSVAQGGSAAVTLTSSVVNGFKATVALSVGGLPKGLTASFASATIASPGSGSSKLTLTAASTLAKGTYNLMITAAGGGVTHTQVISVTVTGH
jgi:pseudomonalisin